MKGLGTGQGALEYLIIVAAVLAIAAIVVLFLTGAFQSTGGDASACKVAASTCAQELATSAGAAPCNYCDTDCPTDNITVAVSAPYISPNDACHNGSADAIFNA